MPLVKSNLDIPAGIIARKGIHVEPVRSEEALRSVDLEVKILPPLLSYRRYYEPQLRSNIRFQDSISDEGLSSAIYLTTKEKFKSSFLIRKNLIAASSTKCERVTRLVFASEIFKMVLSVDIAIWVATTLKIVTSKLQLPEILIMVSTDSYFLYEYLVELRTTKEKKLMIDIIALRLSYKATKIS
ncbi:hypothetical protein MBM_02902 [Drepanopeziza brunnea f. sp. 'multigermtubi' MB_m1]|uniref:Uncharacterized protein n=1 Tax=Marssonina brunnea f. sp. multigermtubi (strain MB_m1) TaxID=1072389 RepID=K1WLV2_MARBU|nr:uncharacterized protein MBM_02902 [Drepanopeziza brunnea f. sp. 'multigermtubi' MB_m1]EKD18660.1 hypothetical protein MBM_02902 [Drepanopeziza brunnea f. sp. 'multigermtubi' MB_m1]